MRSMMVAVALLVSSSTGCALQSGAMAPLLPSMVSPEFKDLDKANPFTKPATKVDFMKTGIASYDGFFKSAAAVRGTVVLADVVLKESDAFVAQIKKEMKSNKVLTPDQVKRINQHSDRIGSLQKLVGGVPERTSKLVGVGNGLIGSAPKTFVGPNEVKLPGVVKGLNESMGDLKDSAAKAPSVLSHAAKTSASLASLK